MEDGSRILDMTFEFSLKVVLLYKGLTAQSENILSKELLRSATSMGANVEEAIGADFRKDFVAKMIVAYKEAREARYWLTLLDRSQMVENDYTEYLEEIDQIIDQLSAIIKTAKTAELIFNN